MLRLTAMVILLGLVMGCAGGSYTVTERVYTPAYYADPYNTPYYYNVDPYPYWY